MAPPRASLRSGNLILALDDQRTETVDALRKVMQSLKGRNPPGERRFYAMGVSAR